MTARFGSPENLITGGLSGITANAQLWTSASPDFSDSVPSAVSLPANWRGADCAPVAAGLAGSAGALAAMSRTLPDASLKLSVSSPEPPVTRSETSLPSGTVKTGVAWLASEVRKIGALPV